MARILVIDDEHNIRRMIRLALVASGHVVETAPEGQTGLVQFGDGTNFDLVIVDQRMPGMEGLDVIRHLKQLRPSLPVIMATAFGTIDLAVDAIKAGATDFLRKPFTAETLRGAVTACLTPMSPASATEQPAVTYATTTINGFRLELEPGVVNRDGHGLHVPIHVQSPIGKSRNCIVHMRPYVVELALAHADREAVPGGDRFWQALCEEAMANHLWQNAEMPEDGSITVDELTSSLKRWIDAVLKA